MNTKWIYYPEVGFYIQTKKLSNIRPVFVISSNKSKLIDWMFQMGFHRISLLKISLIWVFKLIISRWRSELFQGPSNEPMRDRAINNKSFENQPRHESFSLRHSVHSPLPFIRSMKFEQNTLLHSSDNYYIVYYPSVF